MLSMQQIIRVVFLMLHLIKTTYTNTVLLRTMKPCWFTYDTKPLIDMSRSYTLYSFVSSLKRGCLL